MCGGHSITHTHTYTHIYTHITCIAYTSNTLKCRSSSPQGWCPYCSSRMYTQSFSNLFYRWSTNGMQVVQRLDLKYWTWVKMPTFEVQIKSTTILVQVIYCPSPKWASKLVTDLFHVGSTNDNAVLTLLWSTLNYYIMSIIIIYKVARVWLKTCLPIVFKLLFEK